jgi:hypothetical protein
MMVRANRWRKKFGEFSSRLLGSVAQGVEKEQDSFHGEPIMTQKSDETNDKRPTGELSDEQLDKVAGGSATSVSEVVVYKVLDQASPGLYKGDSAPPPPK